MQGIFQKENTDKALKYGIYRHLPTYEKIIRNLVSFYNKNFSGLNVNDVERKQLSVGNNVWIGHGVTIVSSCKKIGNGAVIGAGSVVTRDIPPYSIVAGVPAKVIKYRFDEETIDALENSCWWKLQPEELMEFYPLIDTPLKWANAIINRKNNI